MGLLGLTKKDPFKGESNIEEGKNKRRLHLQNVKNKQIMEENNGSENDLFIYRGDPNEYISFKHMLLSRDWNSIGTDNNEQ